jgi:hypothetical protein
VSQSERMRGGGEWVGLTRPNQALVGRPIRLGPAGSNGLCPFYPFDYIFFEPFYEKNKVIKKRINKIEKKQIL